MHTPHPHYQNRSAHTFKHIHPFIIQSASQYNIHIIILPKIQKNININYNTCSPTATICIYHIPKPSYCTRVRYYDTVSSYHYYITTCATCYMLHDTKFGQNVPVPCVKMKNTYIIYHYVHHTVHSYVIRTVLCI